MGHIVLENTVKSDIKVYFDKIVWGCVRAEEKTILQRRICFQPSLFGQKGIFTKGEKVWNSFLDH